MKYFHMIFKLTYTICFVLAMNTMEEEKLLQDYEGNWTQKGDGKCEEENKDGSSNNDNGEYKK